VFWGVDIYQRIRKVCDVRRERILENRDDEILSNYEMCYLFYFCGWKRKVV
jgi:hypothetical protein